MHRLLHLLGLGVLSLTLVSAACGSDTQPPACTGTSCACEPGAACDIGDSGCSGDSCTLDCSGGATCSGACGSSCSISCGGGSDCDVTVGPSGSVDCSGESTCTVRCTGSCSVTCGAGSTCAVQCPSDTAPQPVVDGGAQCQ